MYYFYTKVLKETYLNKKRHNNSSSKVFNKIARKIIETKVLLKKNKKPHINDKSMASTQIISSKSNEKDY